MRIPNNKRLRASPYSPSSSSPDNHAGIERIAKDIVHCTLAPRSLNTHVVAVNTLQMPGCGNALAVKHVTYYGYSHVLIYTAVKNPSHYCHFFRIPRNQLHALALLTFALAILKLSSSVI
jgi:hypothetical protein